MYILIVAQSTKHDVELLRFEIKELLVEICQEREEHRRDRVGNVKNTVGNVTKSGE